MTDFCAESELLQCRREHSHLPGPEGWCWREELEAWEEIQWSRLGVDTSWYSLVSSNYNVKASNWILQYSVINLKVDITKLIHVMWAGANSKEMKGCCNRLKMVNMLQPCPGHGWNGADSQDSHHHGKERRSPKLVEEGQGFQKLPHLRTNIWRFPKMGATPSHHPFLDGIFPNHPFLLLPLSGKPHSSPSFTIRASGSPPSIWASVDIKFKVWPTEGLWCGGFHSHGGTQKWMIFVRGTPIRMDDD